MSLGNVIAVGIASLLLFYLSAIAGYAIADRDYIVVVTCLAGMISCINLLKRNLLDK